ncbi:hypothetical protein [Mucilaginibacter terrae]|uniref:Translation initiation factor 6 (eIF-6) n=1 Tax=Mucilaginibacter terrae TaxID=1955052 RepID=A0ABU3GYR4_9SPHI|nr:hypothetical protein [Mucilaginibacter terrae]MDT3404913.1 translation initiation factor 6 (eIF-6) [Mucilaginibacter terrae]
MRANTIVDILVGSNLTEPIVIPGVNVRLWCHKQTFLQEVVNCKVLVGCTNDGVAVTRSGSSANVSTSGCS